MNNFAQTRSEATGLMENMGSTFKKHWEAHKKLMNWTPRVQIEDLQENVGLTPCLHSNSIRADKKKSFRIKIPYFPKRPFGKPESFNNIELNFVEIECKDKCHNLYQKQSKFFKIACGRALSVSGRRDRTKVAFRTPLRGVN
jgi:hypothetical protein